MSLRVKYLLITVAIFICEVLIATKLSHLEFIRGYLGDLLVTVLIYFFVKILQDFSPKKLAVGVFIFSVLIETSQYFHLADALGLRRGSILSIVLGNTFSFEDIVMYGSGCITAYFVDAQIIRRKYQTSHAILKQVR